MATTPEMAKKPLSKKTPWQRVIRVFRSIIIIYLLVCLVMYLLQTKLIFPGAANQGSPDSIVRPDSGEELVDLQAADGTSIKGLFCAAEAPRPRPGSRPATASTTQAERNARPAVLYFYGNAECMADCEYQADLFRQLGYHCMLVDYEGFGMSGGKPSEQGCYAAGEAAYRYLLTRPDVARGKIIIAGWSVGGGTAGEVAFQHRGDGTLAGLMTFSTFSSMVDVAQEQYPFLPVSLLLRHRFLNADKLKHLTLPYFAGHGHNDRVISFRNLDRLTTAYAGDSKNLTRFESDSDHNDFFDASGEPLKNAIATFLERATQ
jgi:fermentation-respiration switch protein FrsA (DUF1100 family)